MAPSYQSQTLMVPSIYSSSHSTNYSSSTSDLNSSTYSPRALYASTFDRPHSSGSAPAGSSLPQRIGMKNMTGFITTEDEFEALPIAVRRKYFSTLERLRFAQNSRSSALNDLPIQRTRKSSLADRRGLNIPVIDSRKKKPDSVNRRQRKLSRQQSVSSTEASWFLSLPEKIRKKQFTREEQVILAGRLRESVILDAADEAIYKASRRASRNLTPLYQKQSSTSLRDSFDSIRSLDMEDSLYETFRWMDEESNLDLSLNLDDYHANIDGVVLPSPTSNRRPSFRRHMSISKIPFGRNSLSSIQPRSPKHAYDMTGHARQKSRAISLMAPKIMASDSTSTIDPCATHYQDPEARLKLRVYLASPQKFDEAIEFGFPSMDGVGEGVDKENRPPMRVSKESAMKRSFATEKKETFFNDDAASLLSDDASMVDPDSPITPLDPRHRASPSFAGKGSKTSSDFAHLGITKPTLVKQSESYTQAMAGSREMTLRMTLTRPDLRADESTIYGWQTTKSPLREEPLALEELEGKYDGRGPFGGADGWGPADKDDGVVKRLWNRVKSQKKSV